MKIKEEVFWTQMQPPGKWVLGQKFEFEGRIVEVVDYDADGIPVLIIEYEVFTKDNFHAIWGRVLGSLPAFLIYGVILALIILKILSNLIK